MMSVNSFLHDEEVQHYHIVAVDDVGQNALEHPVAVSVVAPPVHHLYDRLVTCSQGTY